MKAQEKKQWGVIGAIWTVAIALFLWNLSAVRDLHQVLMIDAMERHERQYIQKHTHEIETTILQSHELKQATPSMRLGILSTAQFLEESAQAHKLTKADVLIKHSSNSSTSTQISMSCIGTFSNLLQWLNYLETRSPFLQPTSVKASTILGTSGALFQLQFDYEARIEKDSSPVDSISQSSGSTTSQL